ncbi:MAG: glycosyltransferase family 4 protein [Thermoprotei archaeon]
MRILVLTHRPVYPPLSGYSKVIIDTYRSIAEENRVMIITITPRRKTVRITNIDGVRYVEVPEPKQVFAKLLFTRAVLRISNGELISHHLKKLAETYGDKSFSYILASLIDAILGEPNIIVSETIYPALLGKSLAEYYGIPHIIRTHNIESLYIGSLVRIFKNKTRRNIEELERRVLADADKILTISLRDNILIRKLYGIHNSIYIPPILIVKEPPNSKQIIRKYGLEEHKYFLYIASPHKPNVIFLREILRCKNALKDLGYKIVIGGSISPIAEKYIREGESDVVGVAGILSEAEKAGLIKKSYAVLAPHHGYGISIKLVEALALGVPVITTKNSLSTLKGLVKNKNVYVINSIDEICNSMIKLVRDKELYNTILEGARDMSRALDYRQLAKQMLLSLSEIP